MSVSAGYAAHLSLLIIYLQEHQGPRDYIRAKILRDHLDQVVIHRRSHAQTLADGLSYASAISLVDNADGKSDDTSTDYASSSDEDVMRCLPGALSEMDLRRFAPRVSRSVRQLVQYIISRNLIWWCACLIERADEPTARNGASHRTQAHFAVRVELFVRARR